MQRNRAPISSYITLCKPRVVLLMLITTVVGLLLAPLQQLTFSIFTAALVGVGFAACAGAVLNHLFDQHIDSIMKRTRSRPLPTGTIAPINAIMFGLVLIALAMFLLINYVNWLTAVLTFLTFVGYAIIYTLFLKHMTSQNIVIGGLAGAMPPLLGWTAVTGQVDPQGLLLVLIIYVWTPPHFWALAIHRHDEYAQAQIPMLPVTHGIPYTKLNILLYTTLLIVVSLLPFTIGMSGYIYLMAALLLGGVFLYKAVLLKVSDRPQIAMQTFRYSIVYLFLLFAFLLLDHYSLNQSLGWIS